MSETGQFLYCKYDGQQRWKEWHSQVKNDEEQNSHRTFHTLAQMPPEWGSGSEKGRKQEREKQSFISQDGKKREEDMVIISAANRQESSKFERNSWE